MLQYFAEGKPSNESKYAIQDFVFRWKKLQRIISKQSIDGLLIISGLDGGQHPNTSYLINWLINGYSGAQIYRNRYLDQSLNDVMIYVSSASSHVFLSPISYSALSPLFYALPNCQVYATTQKEFAAKDELDILKIKWFFKIVNQINKIGVYLRPQQDVKAIQKWPIIQSYALGPVGGTFFTLKHILYNLNTKITPLFRNFDRHSIKHLINTTSTKIQGQIKGSLNIIQYTPFSERQHLTQLSLQQPLFEAADIALTQLPQIPIIKRKSQSRILFGNRTSTQQQSNNTKIIENEASHFTIEHCDSVSGLSVWRTYFLNLLVPEDNEVELVQEQQKQSFLVKNSYMIKQVKNKYFQSTKWIVNSYLALIQATIQSISALTKDYRNLNSQWFQTNIVQKINQILSITSATQVYQKNDLVVTLQSYDSFGQLKQIDLKDVISFRLSTVFYMIKLKLNIKSEQKLGSVRFSQAFLLQQGCYTLLTKQTNYIDIWKINDLSNQTLSKLNPNFDFPQLGKTLSNQFKWRMFLPTEKNPLFNVFLPLIEVKYYFHQKGLRLFSQKIGWFVLLYKDIEGATMVNKLPGQWVFFKVKNQIICQPLQSKILAIQFRGKAFDYLLKKVNDKNDALVLTFTDSLPPLITQNWGFIKNALNKQVKDGAYIYHSQILKAQFIYSLLQTKQLLVLSQQKDLKLSIFRNLYQQKLNRVIEQSKTLDKIQITLIVGPFCSGKHRLAANLLQLNKQNGYLFNLPAYNMFSKMKSQTYVEMLQQFIEDNKQCKNLICVVPCWINNIELFELISKKYYIKSVVATLNINSIFTSINKKLAENAITFTTPGYSQSIIMDARGQNEELVGLVIRLLRSFNKQCRIIRSSNGILTSSQANQILKDKSYQSQYQRLLRSKYLFLYDFTAMSTLNLSFLQYKIPIINKQKLQQLYLQEGYLLNKQKILNQLKPLKQEAQTSKDQLMQIMYKIQQKLTFQRKQLKATQIKCIKGILQEQNGNKIQIVWSGSQFRYNIVQKKSKLGLSILCSNYDPLAIKQFLNNLTKKSIILKEKRKSINQSDIDQQTKMMISRQGKQKYLQNGQFYDGYFYRDNQGNILGNHPQLNKLIKEWIEQKNRQIQNQNKKYIEQWQNYCKIYES